ncbi:MAG: hypothetical protein IT162_15050 [Bryobacterales bacterium]|nr:hypothetical protein [Bryobacterales bacterium]
MPLGKQLRRRGRRGNSIIEFGLVAIFLVPLFLGTVNLGLTLGYNLQVAQIARDTGHMYVRQLDFSNDASKELIVRLARGMGMTKNDGKGVVILTKVLYVGDDQCAGGGLAPGECPNHGRAVMVQRHTIGKESLRTSSVGTPPAGLVLTGPDAVTGLKAGDIRPADYLTQAGVISAATETMLPGMLAGETAFIVETYFQTPEWSLQQSYTRTADGVYARAVF